MIEVIYNPKDGMAFQGDVSIIPIPDDIEHSEIDEISPVENRLILQEGEVTGHHHAITLYAPLRSKNFKNSCAAQASEPLLTIRSTGLRKTFRGWLKEKLPTAKLYRAGNVPNEMVRT